MSHRRFFFTYLAVFIILAGIADGIDLSWRRAHAGTAACSTGYIVQHDGTSLGCAAPSRPVATVNTLPTCNSAAQGVMYFVTDALAPVALAAIASGGAVKVGVLCNGTSWIVQ
jgi:hypothetical protein